MTLLFYSCLSDNTVIETKYYSNGKIEYQKRKLPDGTIEYKSYFMNGKVDELYYMINDSIKEGEYLSYFTNGNIAIQGNYKNGFEDGFFKCYYKSGMPEFFLEYIKIASQDSSIVSQRIYFYENGDTIKDSLSFFYTTYFINDTIDIQDEYQFKIELTGARYKNSFIHLGKYDSVFSTLPLYIHDTFSFEKDMTIELKKSNLKIGLNIIRALIVNYDFKEDDKVSNMQQILFIDSFFVKDKLE